MMNKEEQLWNYIDGFCNDVEKADIEAKLAADDSFRQLYLQLLEVNEQLQTHLDIDEPSMSFTRNVMEKVQQEIAPVKLKTKVDSRIIYAIGGFFSVTLLGILIYAIATATPDFKVAMPSINFESKLDGLMNTTTLSVFVFLNAVLLLIYLDFFLRKGMKKTSKK
ncbi:MAG: anti-sigma factor family protein [Pedobacter sp.]